MPSTLNPTDSTIPAEERAGGALSSLVPSGVRVEQIVAEVLRRLELTGASAEASFQLPAGVVSLEQIEQIPSGVTEVSVSPQSVLTPSARDALRERGLRIQCAGSTSPSEASSNSKSQRRQNQPIRLSVILSDPSVESGLVAQVQRRGVTVCPKADRHVVVADAPATAAWNARRSGLFPMVVNRLSDITRFSAQAPVDCWVLDSTAMNFMAVVNAIVAAAGVADFVAGAPSVELSAKGAT